MYLGMKARPIRRVTANLPSDLLEQACRTTGTGITDTLVRGLDLVRRGAVLEKARRLKGRLRLAVDLDASRERARH